MNTPSKNSSDYIDYLNRHQSHQHSSSVFDILLLKAWPRLVFPTLFKGKK